MQTPEDIADAQWRETEALRKVTEKRQSKNMARLQKKAAEGGAASRIRRDVYIEMGFPEDGFGAAEREIERRMGKPEATDTEDISPLDAILALDDNTEGETQSE